MVCEVGRGERFYLATIAHMWNLYYRGKEIKAITTRSKERAASTPYIKLLGTPYDGTGRVFVNENGSLPTM